MKKTRFIDQRIAFVLRQAEEGTAVGEVCRTAGISEATYYNWRKKYGGLMPSEMKRLKQLEEGNQRLKKLVADLSLDKEMLWGTSSAEKYEACPEAGDGRSCSPCLAGQLLARLPDGSGESIDLPLPFQTARAGPTEETDQGDRGDAGTLRLPAHRGAAAPRGLAGQPPARAPPR